MLKKNRMAFPLLHFKEGCLSFKAIAVITIMISQCKTSKELNSSVYTRVFMEDHPTMWLCEQILVPHRSSNTHIQFTWAFLFYLECIFICSPHIYSRWSQLTSVNTHRLTVAYTHLNPDINPAVWFNHSESQGKSGFMTQGWGLKVSRRYPVCLVMIMYTHADTHLRECRPARTAGELVQSDISANGWIL